MQYLKTMQCTEVGNEGLNMSQLTNNIRPNCNVMNQAVLTAALTVFMCAGEQTILPQRIFP